MGIKIKLGYILIQKGNTCALSYMDTIMSEHLYIMISTRKLWLSQSNFFLKTVQMFLYRYHSFKTQIDVLTLSVIIQSKPIQLFQFLLHCITSLTTKTCLLSTLNKVHLMERNFYSFAISIVHKKNLSAQNKVISLVVAF